MANYNSNDIDALVEKGFLSPGTGEALKNSAPNTTATESTATPASTINDILANAAPTAQPNGPQSANMPSNPLQTLTSGIPLMAPQALEQARQSQDILPGSNNTVPTPMDTTPAPAGALVSDSQTQPQQPNFTQQSAMNALSNLNNTYEQEQAAHNKAANAGALQATKEAAYYDTLNKKAQEQDVINQNNELYRQDKLQNQENRVKEKLQEYSKMSLDPEKANIFVNGTTGQKIGSAIAIALSGMGAGLLRQNNNMALDVINNAIERDIQAQKMNIDKKGREVETERGVFHDMLQTFGDQRAAESAAKATMIQSSQIDLQQLASQYKAPQIQAQAEAFNAQLERQKQAHIANVMQSAMQTQAIQNIDPNTPLNKVPEAIRKEWVPGAGRARTPEDAKEASKTISDAKTAESGLNALLNSNFSRTSPTDKAKALAIQQTLIGSLRTSILGPGTINDSERAIMEDLIANPTKMFSLPSSTRATLKTVVERVKVKTNEDLKSRGLNPIYPDSDSLKTLKPNE